MQRIFVLCLLICGEAYADENPAPACNRQLAQEPRFAAIANKLPLADIREISFENLANKAIPSQKERNALAEWVEAHKSCFQMGLEYGQKNYPPQLVALAIEANNKVIAVAASLYNKELTYGAANKQMQSIADDTRNKATAVVEQVKVEKAAQQQSQKAEAQRESDRRIAEQRQFEADSQRQQQAQADAQRRQLAARMLPPPYQIPVPVVRPTVTTNCSQLGNQWTCNSR